MVLLVLGDDAVAGCGFEGVLKLVVEQRSLMLLVVVQQLLMQLVEALEFHLSLLAGSLKE